MDGQQVLEREFSNVGSMCLQDGMQKTRRSEPKPSSFAECVPKRSTLGAAVQVKACFRAVGKTVPSDRCTNFEIRRLISLL